MAELEATGYSPINNTEAVEPVELEAEDLQSPALEQTDVKRPGWFRRNQMKLALAAAGLSLGATVALNPAEQTIEYAKDAVPAAAYGFLAMEVSFNVGLLMMSTAIGRREKNPFKWRSMMNDLATEANNSMLFKTGFWVNTTSAVGQFAIPTAVICTQTPPEAWGMLGVPLADLAVTVAVRSAILDGIKRNAIPQTEE